MRRLLITASTLALAAAATAQTAMPMPAFNNTFTSTLTRGFFFQAPTTFVITGLEVYNEASQPFQVVEVIDFGLTQPPAFPGTVVGTSLFYDNQSASGIVIPCSVTCVQGNWYGVLGACTPSQTSGTSYNSYGVPGAFTSNILGNPVTIARMGTQTGLAASGPNQPCWTEVAFNIARVDVYVAGAQGYATKISFGEGCNRNFASFYETFTGPIDLANTSLQAFNTGSGYLGLAGANAVVPGTNAVAFGDDQVQSFPLGFTINYPGGSTNTLYVSSNGFVHFTANTANGCCAGSVTSLLTGGARWAALWNDLNPSAGGTVYIDIDQALQTALVTFDQVPRFGTGDLNTFQYAFDAAGNVELRWGACAIQTGTTLIGWSPGSANQNPGAIDISATPTFQTYAQDIFPIGLDGDARPVLGTAVNMTVDNIPSGSAFAAVILGLVKHDPGISLASIGMPDCFQYCSQDAVILGAAPGNTFTAPFSVPNNNAFVGLVVTSQGAIYDPVGGHNQLGALSTNGVELTLDIN